MEKKKIDTKKIATTGILLAVVIVLQLIGNYIPTPVNPNLALIPITIGAIMYGPVVGAFLGLVNGAIILASPSTNAVFMSINVWGTICTCLVKSTLAGFIAGLVIIPFRKNHQMAGGITCAVVVPVVNTLVYSLLWYAFFKGMGAFKGMNTYLALFSANQFIIIVNFCVEFALNLVVVPMLLKVLIEMNKNKVNY